MGHIPAFLLRHTVDVDPFAGDGPFGPTFGETAELRCFVDESTRLVRDTDGNEVTSTATVYARLDASVPVGSRVTLPSGRVATVLVATRRDGGGLPTPDHLEIALT